MWPFPKATATRVESDILCTWWLTKSWSRKRPRRKKPNMESEVAKYLDDLRKAAPSEKVFQQQIKASGKTLDQIKAAYPGKRTGPGGSHPRIGAQQCSSPTPPSRNFMTTRKTPPTSIIPEMAHVAHILISVIDPADPAASPPRPEKGKGNPGPGNQGQGRKGGGLRGPGQALLRRCQHQGARAASIPSPATPWRPNSKPSRPPPFPSEPTKSATWSKPLTAITSSSSWKNCLRPRVPFEKVSAGIKEYLADKEINRQLPAYIPKIEAEYDVKFLGTNFSPTPLLPPPRRPRRRARRAAPRPHPPLRPPPPRFRPT